MFYFHIENGSAILDTDGIDLPDVEAARAEAVAVIADVLRDGEARDLWSNHPLQLWVTDEPDGAGRTLLRLHVIGQG